MKIASASPPVVFLLSGHTVVLLVAASVLPVGFSRCGRVPIPALGPYLSPRLAARSACRFPACVKTRIRLPVPPPTRLVSTAFSLCFPRPACAPACADAPLRRACVIPLSSFAPPRLRPGLHESPHPDKKNDGPHDCGSRLSDPSQPRRARNALAAGAGAPAFRHSFQDAGVLS